MVGSEFMMGRSCKLTHVVGSEFMMAEVAS